MSILAELKRRFQEALRPWLQDPGDLLEMIRPSQEERFGDYQANLAMPLGKRLGRSPREIAGELVARLDVADMAEPPEIAGPGFINFRLRTDWLAKQLSQAVADPRLGVSPVAQPKTYVIDYSAPNIAKPMHVGHIRSTVIGDALCRMLRFMGHRVISDNHIGDWGTQFGMILYGFKHFLDPQAYQQRPVEELARLYRLVRLLMDYQEAKATLATGRLQARIAELQAHLQRPVSTTAPSEQEHDAGSSGSSPTAKDPPLRRAMKKELEAYLEELQELEKKVVQVEQSPQLARLAQEHPNLEAKVQAETAKLHAGDPENRRLWQEFLPHCLAELDRIYQRLGVQFDYTLGESFYHDRLAGLVEDLLNRGVAKVSDGAVCIFLEGFDTPMIIRKQDGAFLYATTDLATLQYRMQTWQPDAILYVVDHRQSLHFQQLFAAARLLGYKDVELQHISFGTVLGEDGRPFKTREGDLVGLESLLDEAVARALKIVSENDDAKPDGPELSAQERAEIAQRVGIGAVKYADLSQNRTSDYVFSYSKMLALTGNTSAYMQYAYARVRSIFRKGGVDPERLRNSGAPIFLSTRPERDLGLALLRFGEALELALEDYRPNLLTAYLYELANRYSIFFEQCPVLKAEPDSLRTSRLLLCDLTARTIQKGLELLGIEVVERM
ncbi:MAG: arginine--tRNA ligase [Thermoguttaceae bacterium]|nr:arginine--tRNA ligase [Thermoguttaceae bacterium]MDW8036617.1 arginine--tRNA ligase [Thermoguttaceae bacterium]